MPNINLTDVNAALGTVNAALPILTAAYNLLKGVWLNANPGKTEQDFIDLLGSTSQLNIDEAAAILTAHGYVQDAAGNWSKPTGGA